MQETLPSHQQSQNDDAAPVDPWQHASEVHGGDLRASQAVIDEDAGQGSQGKLQGEPGVSPSQKSPQDRQPQ